LLGDFDDAVKLANARTDGHEPHNAKIQRPLDNGIAFLGKIREIQMAMAVDKHERSGS
jgi:hypothetical protein